MPDWRKDRQTDRLSANLSPLQFPWKGTNYSTLYSNKQNSVSSMILLTLRIHTDNKVGWLIWYAVLACFCGHFCYKCIKRTQLTTLMTEYWMCSSYNVDCKSCLYLTYCPLLLGCTSTRPCPLVCLSIWWVGPFSTDFYILFLCCTGIPLTVLG